MPRYDFKCTRGHVTEKWCNRDVEEILCPCGELAKRVFPLVHHTFGWTLSESSHEVGNPDELVRNV